MVIRLIKLKRHHRCMQHRGLSGQPCGRDEEATDEEATDEEATDEEATDEEATDKDCHILPLTGLYAFVYTGLNAQQL